MPRPPKILKPNETYTFTQYAELPYERDDILADLGCTLSRQRVELPYYMGALQLQALDDQLNDAFQFTTISSEQARREFLIAPIIAHVCRQTGQKVRVEYPLAVSGWLRGTLDYYFQASNLLIIEAKRENLYTGFTQLGAELVALSQWIDRDTPLLYGAVTTGQIWQFGTFDRATQHLTEDPTLYRIPEELEQVVRLLMGILSQQPTPMLMNPTLA
ncbi:hypothetical protein HPC62_11825 [Thermoleptolyngbya sichuanensis A183]|uniref:Type I restriction enzyme R protein N-terminal domain-containing protein n=1 Tax=Thermoleptolyngbya sichuanensis A183 TaxID=2737172 RepID=A0A6M8BGN4_9CYAN|nr:MULTISPECIES: hypothetical protein [Thermoleptolyngbya]QKD82781.1 hypothetical protein HPC62_11825 [Thermoleptolyngbya sichuanensis A183]